MSQSKPATEKDAEPENEPEDQAHGTEQVTEFHKLNELEGLLYSTSSFKESRRGEKVGVEYRGPKIERAKLEMADSHGPVHALEAESETVRGAKGHLQQVVEVNK